ncbi:MAG: hypothetical protein Q9172_002193 [Xanthocarpia lactea]
MVGRVKVRHLRLGPPTTLQTEDHLRIMNTHLFLRGTLTAKTIPATILPKMAAKEVLPIGQEQGTLRAGLGGESHRYGHVPQVAGPTLAFGGVIVPKVNLILSLICREYLAEQQSKNPNYHLMPVMFGTDNPQCRIPEVQSRVSKFTLYGNVITGLLSAVTSPKLGSISDRYGRTSMIAFISSGMLVTEIITILAARMPDTFSVNWLFLGFVCDGVSGSFVASMALTNAYVSDCTPPAMRNVAFGYFQGVLFTGIALGPLIAGYVVKWTGTIVSVFYFAVAAHTFFALFVFLVVPESLNKERQKAAREKADFIGEPEAYSGYWHRLVKTIRRNNYNFLAPLKILWPSGSGNDSAVRRNLITIAAVDTIMFGVAMGSMTVVLIYSEFQFGWGTFETSLFVSVVNVCRVTNLLIFFPTISRLIRGPRDSTTVGKSGSDRLDVYIIRTAIFFDMLGYIGYSSVRTADLFVVSGALASIGGMGSPTLQSALTKHVPPEQTGAVLGAVALLHALARVLGPLIFNSIYSATVGKFTQTVFVCLASTFFIGFVLSWFIRPHVHWEDASPATSSEADDYANYENNNR